MASTESIILELLEENKKLQIRLAAVSAMKRHQDKLELKLAESQNGMTQEIWDSLSPEAQETLKNLRFN